MLNYIRSEPNVGYTAVIESEPIVNCSEKVRRMFPVVFETAAKIIRLQGRTRIHIAKIECNMAHEGVFDTNANDGAGVSIARSKASHVRMDLDVCESNTAEYVGKPLAVSIAEPSRNHRREGRVNVEIKSGADADSRLRPG